MKTKFRADDVVVDMPLFHNGCGGSIPTSALQFRFERINRDTFMPLNEAWHSRLPECRNAFEGWFYGAKFDGEWWAVAWWSKPVARAYNGLGYAELRRFAIKPGSPENTASRMLGFMARDIRKTRPEVCKLISYQDADVHTGTIYKATNWVCEHIGERVDESKTWNNWTTRGNNRKNQSKAPKHRWAYKIGLGAETAATRTTMMAKDGGDFISMSQDLFAEHACASMDGVPEDDRADLTDFRR